MSNAYSVTFDEEVSGLETDTRGIREPLRAVEELVEMGDPAPDVEDEPEAPHRTKEKREPVSNDTQSEVTQELSSLESPASTDESMEETNSYKHLRGRGGSTPEHRFMHGPKRRRTKILEASN